MSLMRRSLSDGLREGRGFRRGMLLALVGFYALALTALGVRYLVYMQDSPSPGEEPKPGLSVYATSTFEAFYCIADGPKNCDSFDAATEQMAAAEEFTYTTLDGRQVTVTTSDLSPEQWQDVGNAVMRDSDLDLGDVQPDQMTTDGNATTFTMPASAGEGQVYGVVQFEFSGSAQSPTDVRVTGVTYEGGAS